MKTRLLLPLLVGFFFVSTANADDFLETVKGCKGLPDAERLACFDQALEDLESGKAVVREVAEESSDDSEGDDQSDFGREHKKTPKVSTMAATIAEVLTDSQNRKVAILDNGQIWRMTEVKRGILWKEGDRVVVSRGVFNSFFLEIEGTNRRVRAKRIQ